MVAASVLIGCSGEDATPIDLDQTTTLTSTSSLATLTPEQENAESRSLAEKLATQQCLDDPEAEQGLIRIVDPETDLIVAEIAVDCADVRRSAE